MNGDAILNALRSWPIDGFTAGLGLLVACATTWMTRHALRDCDSDPGWTPLGWGACAGMLAAGLTIACLQWHAQETPEVRPAELWWRLRPVYHAVLLALLVVCTATDLRTYYILDWATISGMALGLAAATIAGDLQLCHIWVDWNAEVPQLRGPEIPAWLAEHPHWHGLAWSAAGLAAGAGITWLARWVSSLLLGQEALGFGDVMVMGLIGAFVGWQPVLIVFLLAPLCALLAGLFVKLVSSRTYVPYGPYLSLAALLVLFNWRTIWMFEVDLTAQGRSSGGASFALRRLFGDGVGLLILAAMLVGGLVVLLGAWRLYLSIPVQSRRKESGPSPAAAAASESPSTGAPS